MNTRHMWNVGAMASILVTSFVSFRDPIPSQTGWGPTNLCAVIASCVCVCVCLQLDGSHCGFCQWTPKRFGAVNDMWFNIHRVVHKVWLINGDLHMMHDAYNIQNICCVVFFGKWKQIITAGEQFNIVTFFGFKRSRFLAIPVLTPNTELQYDSNTFWTAGINVMSIVAGSVEQTCTLFEYHKARISVKRGEKWDSGTKGIKYLIYE